MRVNRRDEREKRRALSHQIENDMAHNAKVVTKRRARNKAAKQARKRQRGK